MRPVSLTRYGWVSHTTVILLFSACLIVLFIDLCIFYLFVAHYRIDEQFSEVPRSARILDPIGFLSSIVKRGGSDWIRAWTTGVSDLLVENKLPTYTGAPTLFSEPIQLTRTIMSFFLDETHVTISGSFCESITSKHGGQLVVRTPRLQSCSYW